MNCKVCGTKVPEYNDSQRKYYLKNKARLNAKRVENARKKVDANGLRSRKADTED
jgi:hypothetical protein